MIIDVHAHVSAPEGLYAYQANLLASRGGQRKSMYAADDEKVEAALTAHLKFLEEAGTDLQLLSPRPYTMLHHEKPDKSVAALPQCVGTDIKQALPELERCVKELGFVGCLVNPDPGARGDDSTPA